MSVLGKPVTSLTADDLRSFKLEGPTEGVRLEFKREALTREKLLKEVSAFANTFGGDVIIGASESGDGKLDEIPGCALPSGYRQTVIQWCQTGLHPPMTPMLSDELSAPDAPELRCLVIRVPESTGAPHFIHGRKGCYVRTDEHSKFFQPDLATSPEIAHLMDRRARARGKVVDLFARSSERLDRYLANEYHSRTGVDGDAGARVLLQLCPAFPVEPVVELAELRKKSLDSVVHGVQTFPYIHEAFSQHESIIGVRPNGSLEFTDISIYGSFFCCLELEHVDRSTDPPQRYAFFGHLASHILDAMRYFHSWSQAIGYDGAVDFRIELVDIQGVTFRLPSRPRYHRFDDGTLSRLDTNVATEFTFSPNEMVPASDAGLRQVLVRVAHAIGWQGLATEKEWGLLREELFRRRGLTTEA